VLPKTVINNYNKVRPQLAETGLNITQLLEDTSMGVISKRNNQNQTIYSAISTTNTFGASPFLQVPKVDRTCFGKFYYYGLSKQQKSPQSK